MSFDLYKQLAKHTVHQPLQSHAKANLCHKTTPPSISNVNNPVWQTAAASVH